MFFNVFHLRPCQPHIPNSCFNVLWPSRFRDFHVLAAAAEIILEQAASQEERKLRQQRAGGRTFTLEQAASQGEDKQSQQQRAEGGQSLLSEPRAKVRTGRANSSARREDNHF